MRKDYIYIHQTNNQELKLKIRSPNFVNGKKGIANGTKMAPIMNLMTDLSLNKETNLCTIFDAAMPTEILMTLL